MKPQFVHLRLHTEYSLCDGVVKIKPLMQALRSAQMPAVAITDQHNLFAAVKYYQAATAAGIKPIFGVDILVENEADKNQPFPLVLLCQNNTGYHNLTCLISKAYRQGQYKGIPLVSRSWLAEYHQGLIALSGGRLGDIGQALLAHNNELAATLLQQWQALFPQRFYIELQRTGREHEEDYLQLAVQLAHAHQVPVVATNDVRFIDSHDFEAHEARVAIHDGYTLNDPKRPKRYSQQQYLRSPEEMCKLFADYPEAIANTVEIAKRCNMQLQLGTYYLPNFPIPDGMTIETFLTSESQQGLEQRLAFLFNDDAKLIAEKRAEYDERLQIELDVINSMGFAGYFLIVADFIRWAKQHGVPVGPGRGSGAGSLVAYVLDITTLDPLKYDLLFERFLNPERVSMPDFDVDFCMDGRDRVIEYVADKYGHESVSQIITYGTMAAKAVVRDVGRVLGHPYGFVDRIAKLIPFEIGMTLDKALADEDALRDLYNQEEEVQVLIDLAKKLEGITRNAGKHAGGVVIAPSNLTDFTPLYHEDNGSSAVTQFDKDDVETIGLVKFDFLGLRTLTIINWAVQNVNVFRRQQGEVEINIDTIPVDDTKTFDLLKACTTTAVFQLESRGMKDLIKRLQPDCFEDIVALVALFRPGPLQSGMVDDFIDRKHGRAVVEYPHPDLEPILRPTYGVILYQEQVMQIAQVLAGYTLGGADLLRRAMGKKKPAEMAKQRVIFTEGATKRGVDADVATGIFDLMEKFAGYGFNKSHSAAYALVAYQTAWLKAHYPAEFMAAVLSSDMDNTDKVVTFAEECKSLDIPLLPPNINQGMYKFTVSQNKEIIYGLGAIKGVGEAVIEEMVSERQQQGDISDLFSMCQRLDLRKANKRVFEALIKSGALDSFNVSRASLMASLPKAMKLADQQARDEAIGQEDLFAAVDQQVTQPEYITATDWREKERLAGEKDTLGMYFSGHPINRYLAELNQFTTARISELKPQSQQSVVIAGFLVAIRTMLTKRGDRMAFVAVDDASGRIELAVFSDVYQESRELLTSDQLLVIEGEVSIDDYSGGYRMTCQRVMSIDEARNYYGKQVCLKVEQSALSEDLIGRTQAILKQFNSGACPVCIEYNQQQAQAKINLGNQWRVSPCDDLLDQLSDLFGQNKVTIEYA